MNMEVLASVIFGEKESLDSFLLENGLQHQLFRDTLAQQNVVSPAFPLVDVDVDLFDDWLQMHQVEHEFFAAQLELSNPFNMLDMDFRKEDDFYEWLSQHYLIHLQIAASLGISSGD
jgi:hypothetical protein